MDALVIRTTSLNDLEFTSGTELKEHQCSALGSEKREARSEFWPGAGGKQFWGIACERSESVRVLLDYRLQMTLIIGLIEACAI